MPSSLSPSKYLQFLAYISSSCSPIQLFAMNMAGFTTDLSEVALLLQECLEGIVVITRVFTYLQDRSQNVSFS
eukprot:scaffold262852_cov23-Tisochrysis_lutea.AAC.1